MKKNQIVAPTLLFRFFATLLLAMLFLNKVYASDVESVSPLYGTQGSSNLTVTITLDEDARLSADQDAVPNSVTLGDLSGILITRTDTTTITADFTIDSDEVLGAMNLEVFFPDLDGAPVTYFKENTFWVTEDNEVSDGYILFAPFGVTTTYLIDNDGDTQKSWDSDYHPGLSVYLLEDGTLLRTGAADNDVFGAEGGAGGIVEQYDWDGDLLRTIEYSSDTYCAHHDIEMLPNGNILIIAWQLISEDDAIAAGRDSSELTGDIWADSIIEIDPDGNIVWEWFVWDHLVQDFDSTKANYVDDVSDYPGRIDVNFSDTDVSSTDWNHINSIDYNEELDQILVSVHNFSEVWIIDHSTTKEEAATASGGNSGKGGDLLYRWGNPNAYGAGADDDQILFTQHDATWLRSGYPGEGNILIFNNRGGSVVDEDYTTVVEFTPSLNEDGLYDFDDDLGYYGPESPIWTWEDDPATDFYVSDISGAQRQRNGNTIITNGQQAYAIEVNSDGDQLWEYDNGNADWAVFRFERYAADFSGFDGTELDDETEAEHYFGAIDEEGEGWISVPSLGPVYVLDFPFFYFADQESWFYASVSTEGIGYWIYDYVLGWMWTSDASYAWIYIVDADGISDWTYYGGVIDEDRYFFFVSLEQWRAYSLDTTE